MSDAAHDGGAGGATPGALALVGDGAWTEGCAFDAELLAASGGTTVTVLPTAAAYERPELATEQAAAHFARFGGTVEVVDVLDRRGAHVDANVERVRAARFLYLASGSAMHLLSVLKQTPLWEAIVAAHRGGAVLAAAGPSATVLCDAMVDPRGGGFGVGLGLVRSLSLIPRYDQWSTEKSRRTIQMAPKGLVLAGIPSTSALIRRAGGHWEPVGAEGLRLFRDGQPVGFEVLAELG
ncbi:MAG: Type 1 glutamine amidotransferase-like domain-containing protein [Acidimicrobiia bacterium]